MIVRLCHRHLLLTIFDCNRAIPNLFFIEHFHRHCGFLAKILFFVLTSRILLALSVSFIYLGFHASASPFVRSECGVGLPSLFEVGAK